MRVTVGLVKLAVVYVRLLIAMLPYLLANRHFKQSVNILVDGHLVGKNRYSLDHFDRAVEICAQEAVLCDVCRNSSWDTLSTSCAPSGDLLYEPIILKGLLYHLKWYALFSFLRPLEDAGIA